MYNIVDHVLIGASECVCSVCRLVVDNSKKKVNI